VEVPKVLADVFEALAGAIYIDSGYSLDKTWAVFYRLMQNELGRHLSLRTIYLVVGICNYFFALKPNFQF